MEYIKLEYGSNKNFNVYLLEYY